MKILPLVTALLLVLAILPAEAHMSPAPAPPPGPDFKVEKVAEGTYCLFGRGGNIGVVITSAAVLIVDTQFEAIAPGVKAEIEKLSSAPLRYVVNTHFHGDHVGGNGAFAQVAEIVGHENVRRNLYQAPQRWAAALPARIGRMEQEIGRDRPLGEAYREMLERTVGFLKSRLEGARAFDPGKVVAPSLVFQRSLRLYLGGEEVVIFHTAPGHTDGDSVVYLPGRKVVHMGDLLFNGIFPFIDLDGGGSSEGWIRNLDAVLERVPADTRFIAGHGAVAGIAELKRLRDYFSDLRGAVGAAVARGRTLEEAVEEIRLDEYAEFDSSWMSLPLNIHQVWQETKKHIND
jgi:glyoxylase-like metal-dependent hydrolase (beta-lactamase superfamily II)